MVSLRIKINASGVYKLKPSKIDRLVETAIIMKKNQFVLFSEIDLMLLLFWFFEMEFSKVIRFIKNFGAGIKGPLGSL